MILFLTLLLLLFLPLNTSNQLLHQITDSIAAKKTWDPAAVRVSDIDLGSAWVGNPKRYEFHVRVGRTVLIVKLSDEDGYSWRRVEKEFGSDAGGGFVGDPRSALGALELEGPVEVRGNDELALSLPHNLTNTGLRRILVGKGITIKVEGAHEVSLSHPYDIGLSVNRSSAKENEHKPQLWPLSLASCDPLLSVQVVGSASLVAYKTCNSEAHVKTSFHTRDTIELLPDKCYRKHFKHIPSFTIGYLSTKLVLLDQVLRSFLGNSTLIQGGKSARFLKAKISSSTLVQFRLELERDITDNDRIWKEVEAWRTKPVVERTWFEIVARVEAGKGLRQMVVRKLAKPSMTVESIAWSNLMSNISFTQFTSVVVPPEALTLDVKW